MDHGVSHRHTVPSAERIAAHLSRPRVAFSVLTTRPAPTAPLVDCSYLLGRSMSPGLPVPWTPPGMRDGHDDDPRTLDSVDHTERKPSKQIATRAGLARGPSLWLLQDAVSASSSSALKRADAVGLPPRRRFGVDYRRFEILKLPNHDPPPRGYVFGPRPTARS